MELQELLILDKYFFPVKVINFLFSENIMKYQKSRLCLKNLIPGRFNCLCGSKERIVSSPLSLLRLPSALPATLPSIVPKSESHDFLVPLHLGLPLNQQTERAPQCTTQSSTFRPHVSPLGFQNYQNWRESQRLAGNPPTLQTRTLSPKEKKKVLSGL